MVVCVCLCVMAGILVVAGVKLAFPAADYAKLGRGLLFTDCTSPAAYAFR